MKDLIKYLVVESSGWEWDDECNNDGKIEARMSKMTAGGRESEEAIWELEKLDEDDDYYHVQAVCVKSDIRGIRKGFDFEFDLPKDIEVWDIDDELKSAYDDETNYGGRG